MLDISRNRVPKMECLFHLVDALKQLRYNELQLYTEHTFAYKEHERVWRDASPMTRADIQTLDQYCQARGIELVPNQNSFGHMERWLKHAEYRHLAECPDGFEHPIAGWKESGSTLLPCLESAEFMDALYAELLPNFHSNQLHIGGDEPWELGHGRSRDVVQKQGKHTVYLNFLKELFAKAKARGATTQFWADILLEKPECVTQIPQNVTPVIWGYDVDSPYAEHCEAVASAGFRGNYYVAPGAGNWNSFGGRLEVARANIERAADQGPKHAAKGLLLTAWGDNGHHQPWATLYPPLILAAQACWGRPLAEEYLPELIEAVFSVNRSSAIALCQLGLIDGLLPQPLPPTSFLHAAFFANEDQLAKLVTLTETKKLRNTLLQLNTISQDGIDKGVQLGIEMNRFALERCLKMEQSQSIESLKKQFKVEWERHSRVGGLADSLDRFPKRIGSWH